MVAGSGTVGIPLCTSALPNSSRVSPPVIVPVREICIYCQFPMGPLIGPEEALVDPGPMVDVTPMSCQLRMSAWPGVPVVK